jgi:hypothetical protein
MLFDVVLWLPGKIFWCLVRSLAGTDEYADDIDDVIKQYAQEQGFKLKGE